MKSVKSGKVVIKGRSSSLFLCMDNGGNLKGQRHYTEADCTFRELLLADGYTRLFSTHHRHPVSLASKHSSDQHTVPFTRFLPLRNTLAEENSSEHVSDNLGYFDVDSNDPLGMGLKSMVSPQFSIEK
ncbi:uncharacterized protein V6R79_013736 [Siganus canaliculatus]